jgi:two-component system sensor histidine kinase KdpD
VGVLGRRQLALPDFVMLYLLTIMVAATVFGRGPSLVASTLSVLAYDFFFIPPFFTFVVDDQRHLLTFAMMFVVGLVISGLAQRVRRHEREATAAVLRARTEEMRSALLSAVSHDLRTPLAAITGAATTLREGSRGGTAPDQADLLDTICEEAERLERLVRNLLDMTRLESGSLVVKREWVPLEEIVGAALTRLDAQLVGRPVRAALPSDLPLLSVDAILLEQVFVNLLENAGKYTPANSALDLTARVANQTLVIEVADRGPGLPPGGEARIFEKFYRGQPAGPPGAGLGLAICRGIVHAHGGTIVAEQRDGGGALFRIVLPLSTPPPPIPAEVEPVAELQRPEAR